VRFIPGIISRNWQLKIPALAMAVLLWTVLRFESQNRQVIDDVPVRVALNDPEWAMLGEPLPTSVRVTLAGPARELIALAVERPPVVIPVDEVVTPDTAVLLHHAWVRLPNPERVSVEAVEPSSVRLSFQPMEVQAVPLAPRVSGSLPEGLSLAAAPRVEPSLARVSGPANRLQALDSLPLAPVDLSGITESQTVRQPVDTAGLRGMALSPQEASVRIRVEETVERSFSDIVLRLPELGQDPQLQARPESVTVTVAGARSLVEAMGPSEFRVTLPVGRVMTLAPGEEARVQVAVDGLPELIRARVSPEWVVLRRPAGR
jgi:YbbR domain-containing protein